MLVKLIGLPWTEILACALAVSEGLALLPQLKANGILHGLIGLLKTAKEKLSSKKAE